MIGGKSWITGRGYLCALSSIEVCELTISKICFTPAKCLSGLKPSDCSSDSQNSDPIWTDLFACSPGMGLHVEVLLTQVRGGVMEKKGIIVKSRFQL